MSKTKEHPIQLHFESREQIVVVPDDKDRFVTTAGEAARACKQADDDREWQEQFNGFLSHIHQWCRNQRDKVSMGCVSVGDAGLNVLIGLRTPAYDFAFEDAIVKLDVQLAKRFPRCVFDVLQVPNQKEMRDELTSEALVVYAD